MPFTDLFFTHEVVMSKAHSYAAERAADFRQQLYQLIRIPSVSTDPERVQDMKRATEWLVQDMQRIGFHRAEVLQTAGHPVVYGEWMGAGDGAPTVLVYGHYDVQPAEMADGWTSEPFEPVERDGLIYARGASDDKGQVFAQLKAAEALLKGEGGAPVNIKFLIEGEEEIGSMNLSEFVKANASLLKADVCVISDGSILNIDQPSIVYSLRGLVYTQLEVYGPSHDLHSGTFGGTVHNPLQAICEIIAQLHNPDGSINVPGFYDDVLTLADDERAELKKTDWPEDEWRRDSGAPLPWGEAQFTLRERMSARPTLEVNGILGGFTGEGQKTVLPAKAMAKISCRLVANQDANQIYQLLKEQIARLTPPTVHSELKLLAANGPGYVDRNVPAMKAAIRAYEQGWGKTPVFMREGGSLPIVPDLQTELGVSVMLMGFGLNSDGAHGPDEHYSIEMFHKGIDTAIHFFKELGKL
jgi:acetylornithine deacetylase/succinyl-diaminopimelate desuccinylase-like protein